MVEPSCKVCRQTVRDVKRPVSCNEPQCTLAAVIVDGAVRVHRCWRTTDILGGVYIREIKTRERHNPKPITSERKGNCAEELMIK